MDAQMQIFGLMKAAEDQQAAVKAALDSLATERRIIVHIRGLSNVDPFFAKFDQERDAFLAEFKAAGVKSLTIADVMDESKTSIERCKVWADTDKAKFKRCITDYCDHSSLKDEFRLKFVERINEINQQVGLPSIH